MLPSPIGIGLVLAWPTIQVGLLPFQNSFRNFGLGQPSHALPAQWVGFANGQAAAEALGLVTR